MKYDVKIHGTFSVNASSQEEAEQKAAEIMAEAGEEHVVSVALDKRHEAGIMLDYGASYNEVARTLHTQVKHVSRWYPGRGWTKKQGVEYRKMKALMEKAEIGREIDTTSAPAERFFR